MILFISQFVRLIFNSAQNVYTTTTKLFRNCLRHMDIHCTA